MAQVVVTHMAVPDTTVMVAPYIKVAPAAHIMAVLQPDPQLDLQLGRQPDLRHAQAMLDQRRTEDVRHRMLGLLVVDTPRATGAATLAKRYSSSH